MAEWLVGLTGDQWDLEQLASHLRSPDYTVVRQEGQYYLKSPSFDPLASAEKVRQVAIEVLQAVNGLVKLLQIGGFQPVEVGHLYRVNEDGRRQAFISLSRTITPRGRLAALNRTTGVGTADIQQPTLLESWMIVALGHRSVADALRYFDFAGPRWFSLYKVLEVIAEDVGGQAKIITNGWASRDDLRRFRHTANNKLAIGDEARHGRATGEPPEKPMSLPKAESLIRSILEHWIRSKGSSG